MARFQSHGAQVLAISNDGMDAHRRFALKLGGLPFPLVSDTENVAIQAYGVLNEKGTAAVRSLFVVDKTGVLRHVNPKYELSKPAQYEAVFQVLQELNK